VFMIYPNREINVQLQHIIPWAFAYSSHSTLIYKIISTNYQIVLDHEARAQLCGIFSLNEAGALYLPKRRNQYIGNNLLIYKAIKPSSYRGIKMMALN
jgi:hypothetical protein